jgi:KipI family sensor histidine kinase inhibitor
VKILPAGDSALTLEFGGAIDPAVNAQVNRVAASLTADPVRGVLETVPAYCSLLLRIDPRTPSFLLIHRLKRRVRSLIRGGAAPPAETRELEVPVCYGGDFGPDLSQVAELSGLSEAEVIRRHSGVRYQVYMLGFLPGFPYLGGLDPSIAVPRLKTPRQEIPPGAVGIGGQQTGIYPLPSPGGWRLIGRTPLKLYDPERAEPVLFRAGDFIRFIPVTPEQYKEYEV